MVVQDCFPEGEVMNILGNFFEGCNKGVMGKKTEGRGPTVKWGEMSLDGCGVGGL